MRSSGERRLPACIRRQLADEIVFGRLPNTAGKLPALPSKTEGCASARSHYLASALFVNRAAAEVEEC